jgi:hypothetical protein
MVGGITIAEKKPEEQADRTYSFVLKLEHEVLVKAQGVWYTRYRKVVPELAFSNE